MTQLAIVADDLTGAADTGSCFADAGFVTVIPLRHDAAPPADVVAISSESRDLEATEAGAAVASIVRDLLDPRASEAPPRFYKKIDSAMRGHPRAELRATMAAAGVTRALVAPAFPAEGRTTIGGKQFVDGLPVDRSWLGMPGVSSDLVAHFSHDGETPVALLDLETVRSGGEAVRAAMTAVRTGILVADAETDADLAALAAESIGYPDWVMCGAAGFARQLARVLPLRRVAAAPCVVETGTGPVLIVAGSRHEATARQLEVASKSGVPVVRLGQSMIESSASFGSDVAARVAAHLERGESVVVTTVGLDPSSLGERSVAAILAHVATDPRIVKRVGGLVLTGGDVAMAVCAGLEAGAIRLRGDVAPGIPWGTLVGGARPGLPVVTKAGSFGDDLAMVNALKFLTQRAGMMAESMLHGAAPSAPVP